MVGLLGLRQVAATSLKSDLVFSKLLVEVVGALSGAEECIPPLLACGAALHLASVISAMVSSTLSDTSRRVLTMALEVRVDVKGVRACVSYLCGWHWFELVWQWSSSYACMCVVT